LLATGDYVKWLWFGLLQPVFLLLLFVCVSAALFPNVEHMRNVQEGRFTMGWYDWGAFALIVADLILLATCLSRKGR
jgi:hypothetical protein